MHALLGENGAGKSTLVNVLTGVHHPDKGTVLVDGEPVEIGSPHDAAARGIRVIHQELAFVPQLDVATNLSLGEIPIHGGRLLRLLRIVDRNELRMRAETALAVVGHPVKPETRAADMSVAQAQLVEIARALSSHFRILLLDEPTSALSPFEQDELFAHLRRFKDSGIGILYISHRLEEVIEIADRVTVLRDGRVVGQLSSSELSMDRIIHLMSGSARKEVSVEGRHVGNRVLEVRGLTREPFFRDVSFSLHAGEIVGLTGLVGAGRTEIARCIFGADPFEKGEILFDGRPIRPASPREAIDIGIGYATEDRKLEGIFHVRPIRDNILIGPMARRDVSQTILNTLRLLDRRAVDSMVWNGIRTLGIRPANPTALAGTISGGNQQKVVLARWLASKVRTLILDEPTRGIDVASKFEIWGLIKQLAADGVAILAISSEVPELLGNADRIVVMKAGRIVSEVSHEGATEAEVMHLAGGSS